MSEPQHHTDPIEENIDSHPVQLAIGIAIGTAALIVGIILLAHFAIGAYGERSLKNDPTMRDEAVKARVAPDAKLAVDANAPVAPPAPAATPAPAAAPVAKVAAVASGAAGKGTFDQVCTACHSTGAAGAPKLGDKAAWGPRIAQGKEALYKSALGGKGAMPAKGGNPAIADADVKAAVDYMVGAAK